MTKFFKSYWRQEDSPGIVSDVFHSPESFARDYERMERDLKVYIDRDRDPGEYFQLPSKLTGGCTGARPTSSRISGRVASSPPILFKLTFSLFPFIGIKCAARKSK